ncbi:MAG: excinuclease ABC subunit C, partial [Bacteroidetes bacterium]|nr:excinuclease ABC subunit C [Bacteroidota bacterium]
MIIDNGHLKKLNLIIRSLPDKPGVYQFLDEEETIIYIGKAKNLKKRVQSYFNKDILPTGKLATLVRKIADIHHLIVDTETDAFLLENNLIKKYQPRYNVMLKDDKTFPWICIKNEPFPRVFSTRNIIRDGSEYYGPYASGRIMHAMLDLIRQLFHVRTCNLNLAEKNITARKFRVCLEYHIGNCKGPCEALVSGDEYTQMIGSIRDIIKGN